MTYEEACQYIENFDRGMPREEDELKTVFEVRLRNFREYKEEIGCLVEYLKKNPTHLGASDNFEYPDDKNFVDFTSHEEGLLEELWEAYDRDFNLSDNIALDIYAPDNPDVFKLVTDKVPDIHDYASAKSKYLELLQVDLSFIAGLLATVDMQEVA